jgi:hypothetical protein
MLHKDLTQTVTLGGTRPRPSGLHRGGAAGVVSSAGPRSHGADPLHTPAFYVAQGRDSRFSLAESGSRTIPPMFSNTTPARKVAPAPTRRELGRQEERAGASNEEQPAQRSSAAAFTRLSHRPRACLLQPSRPRRRGFAGSMAAASAPHYNPSSPVAAALSWLRARLFVAPPRQPGFPDRSCPIPGRCRRSPG